MGKFTVEKRANGSVRLYGYVNVTERLSKPVMHKGEQIREQIYRGAFADAIAHAVNPITVNVDHDVKRIIASTGNGTATLFEDEIGLFADITVTDPVVIAAIKAGKIKGWSFSFRATCDKIYSRSSVRIRTVYRMELFDVSIIIDRVPAYPATSVFMSDGISVEADVKECAPGTRQNKKYRERLEALKI